MDVERHFRSLTAEFEALKDRVRNFIDNAHWPTDGEWKESVLRSALTARLPEAIRVGRGFVLTRRGATSQCDVLLYRADAPVLFRDGELVILTPDAVRGIIEVKSRLTMQILKDALDKFAAIGSKLGSERSQCFFGLFSYESEIQDHQLMLELLREKCDAAAKIVDLMSLGCSTFVRWWVRRPRDGSPQYKKWHSYNLDHMAVGYFIANVVDFVSSESVARNDWLWFPQAGKEPRKTGEIAFRNARTGYDRLHG